MLLLNKFFPEHILTINIDNIVEKFTAEQANVTRSAGKYRYY